MRKRIFKNSAGKLRDIWWIPIFFTILVALLFPTILAAQKFSFEVPIPLQVIILVVTTWLIQTLRKSTFFEITGKFNSHWLKQFTIGVGIGFILMILPAIILFSFNFVDFNVNTISFKSFLNSIYIYISVALAEELLFRGFIFQRLIASIGKWGAQIVIAFLFLLTHSGTLSTAGEVKILGSLNIFLASILFGLAFIKTSSLALPIGIHFIANLTQGTLLGFGVSGESNESLLNVRIVKGANWIHGSAFGLEASIFGLMAVILTTICLFKWNRNTPNSI